MTDLFIFAGEASGDHLGSELLKALKQRNPNLKIEGVFGPLMRKENPNVKIPMEEFQVMGFIDVIKAIPKLRRLFYQTRKLIEKSSPKALLLIDYPGFNLRLAKSLKKRGFKPPIIQYVCPSVWAWKKGRIKTMEKVLNHLICLFPFEPSCFIKSPLTTSYFGHPLSNKIHNHSYTPSVPSSNKPILAIFPGSRKKEVERNLPLLLEVASAHCKGEYRIKVSYANEKLKRLIEPLLKNGETLVSSNNNYDLMKTATFAFAVSGTITLELAMHELPSIVCYAIRPFDFFLARNVFRIDLPHYCIANYTAKTRIFPEFYGPHFCREMLDETLSFMLNNEEEITLCKNRCKALKKVLNHANPSLACADYLLESLQSSKGKS